MSKATKTQSMKYIDLISQNDKSKEKEQLQFRADEAKLSVQSSILETKKAIASARIKLSETQRAIPYLLSDEIDATQNLEALEEGLALAERIQKERF